MNSKYPVDKDTITALCRDQLGYYSKKHYLAEPFEEHNINMILVVVVRKIEDEVLDNGLPSLYLNM